MEVISLSEWDEVATRRIRIRRQGGPNRVQTWRDGNADEKFAEILLHEASGKQLVLDVGSGEGRMARRVCDVAHNVVGVDISAVAVNEAMSSRAHGTSFLQSDAAHLPFSDETFDLAYSRRGFIEQSRAALTEVGRVMRRGGVLLGIANGEFHRREVRLIFGRGQIWPADGTALEAIRDNLQKTGLDVRGIDEYLARNCFTDIDSFVDQLEMTPAIPDFDRHRDVALIQEAARQLSTPRGIEDTEHAVVFIATK